MLSVYTVFFDKYCVFLVIVLQKRLNSSFFTVTTEKPSIDLSRVKDITVRAGENIKIALPIKGWPVPTASWKRGDDDIYKDDRNNIEVRSYGVIIEWGNRGISPPCLSRLLGTSLPISSQFIVLYIFIYL